MCLTFYLMMHLLFREATELHNAGKLSDILFGLVQGPHDRVRVFNRCFINGFLFWMNHVESKLSTQNSGVVVKGDESTGNMDWYGVIKRIILLDFPHGKEGVLFQCDWYDVPTTVTNKGRGFKKDKYGNIDIDITRFRYLEDPYILGTQVEQVFYVKGTKNPKWSTVIRMKPRNLFSMLDAPDSDNGGEIDLDSLDLGAKDMNVVHTQDDMTTWVRSDMEGVSCDVYVIQKALAECRGDEPCDLELDNEDDEDDTYIDDGLVAPLQSIEQDLEDDFYI
jgi:hypothetical protein